MSAKNRNKRRKEERNRKDSKDFKVSIIDKIKNTLDILRFKANRSKKDSKINVVVKKQNSADFVKSESKINDIKIPQFSLGRILKNNLFEMAKEHKKCALAIAFSGVMFIVGVGLFVGSISSNDVAKENFAYEISDSEFAKENPLLVQMTNILGANVFADEDFLVASNDAQANTLGKISINPAISTLVQVVSDDNMLINGEVIKVSLAPSMKNIQENLELSNPLNVHRDVYEMVVDGKLVAVFDNPDDSRAVVDKIISRSTREDSEILNIEYKQNMSINKVKKSVLVAEKAPEIDEIVDYLLTGTKEKQQYTIVAGDIPESIAEANGMTIEELQAANPEIIGNGNSLQIGQVLDLIVPVPMLTIVTTEKENYKTEIAYEVEEVEDADMYEGETSISVAGINGEREVVAEVKRENGVEVDREVVSETVLSEPSKEILIVGTKPAPPRKGTGVLNVPITRGYTITSGFGPRWGRMHEGIDMGCPTGTPILAADGGEVIMAGYYGGYGYTVQIDHGGNIVTQYSHCSALHVSEGDMVFQGEHIADVGNTGNSYGAHLHFEVMKNGYKVDPSPYIYN